MKWSSGLVAAGIGLALGTAPAHATYVGVTEDPAGDAPAGSMDLVAVGLGYDPQSGRLLGAVQLREAPQDVGAAVALIAASGTATGCTIGPAIGFGTPLDRSAASWLLQDAAGVTVAQGAVTKRRPDSTVQTLDVTDRALVGLRPECLLALVVDAANPQVVYDTAGPIALVPQPGLSVRLTGVPGRVTSGRTYRVKVKLTNPGAAPTGRLKLRLAKARGLSVAKRSISLPSVRPGASRTATLRVRFSAKARVATDLKVAVSAGKLKATAEHTVYVRTPTRKSTPRGGGGGGGGQVCTRFIPSLTGDAGYLGLVPC